MLKINILFSIFLTINTAFSQFDGAAGTIGSNAISQDDSRISSWATSCLIERGFQDIADPSLGFASYGDSSMAIGFASLSGLVSLGDAGSAVLTFENPIANGEGFDFAVFENSFSDDFLELAFVEVSSDGINFHRFPATCNMQNNTQIGAFDNMGDPTKINNLAGKYRGGFGTPFDLQELANINGLNVNSVTHIKIIDVVGSINPLFASFDSNNNVINDPYPTAFASGGFDLDGVGVINQLTNKTFEISENSEFSVFPNPKNSGESFTLFCADKIKEIVLYDVSGNIVFMGSQIEFKSVGFQTGIYFLKVRTEKGNYQTKITII